MVVVADALHFLDAELAAGEIARVLAPGGALALVTYEWGKTPFTSERRFHDETPIDHATLDRILRSISFIGPAMNPARFADFRERVHALSETPVWARTFVLRSGRRPRPRPHANQPPAIAC
jgi:hypothetical protein